MLYYYIIYHDAHRYAHIGEYAVHASLSTRKEMSSPFTKGDPSCIEGTATPFLIDCAHRYAHLGEHEVHDGGIWWSLLE